MRESYLKKPSKELVYELYLIKVKKCKNNPIKVDCFTLIGLSIKNQL